MLCIIILGGFMTIKVKIETTVEYFVEAQNEEHARRIIAGHYSNNSLNSVEQGYTVVSIFSEEDDDDFVI